MNPKFLFLNAAVFLSLTSFFGGCASESPGPKSGEGPSGVNASAANVSVNLSDFVVKNADSALYCMEDDEDGELCLMNQESAKVYCESQGTRLPTAREAAQSAKSSGAAGIRETAFPSASITLNGHPSSNSTPIEGNEGLLAEIQEMSQTRYAPIYKQTEDNLYSVEFYFSAEGYVHPAEYGFWTSSAQHYVFENMNENRASIYAVEPESIFAVRCVSR